MDATANHYAGEFVPDFPLDRLTLHPGNARQGDVDIVAASLAKHGQFKPLVVQRRAGDGTEYVVLAGNHTLKGMRKLGWETGGVTLLDIDDTQATQILLIDNRASDDSSYDDQALVALLEQLSSTGALEGSGFDSHDLDSLLHSLTSYGDHDTDLAEHTSKPPKPRTLPVRATICAGPNVSWAAAVFWLGFLYGIRSSDEEQWTRFTAEVPKYVQGQRQRLGLIDNRWHDYDHAHHLDVVSRLNPIAATTRDIMTRDQCSDAGVEFFPLEAVLDMAEQVAEHCDEVLLIPKHDVIDQLPETIGNARVVLGYSVPSSYGATPLAPAAFRGRPVHLLGGSWRRQQQLLHELGDDVVSIDTNVALISAEHLTVIMPGSGGKTKKVTDMLLIPDFTATLRGMFSACVTVSLLSIAIDLFAWNNGVGLAPVEPIPVPRHEGDDE